MKVYVGHYKYCECAYPSLELEQAHPHDFLDILNRLKRNIWSNNVLVINNFLPEHVIVCSKNGMKSLRECPNFDRFKGFPSGEIWLMVGEDWVDK